MPVVRRSRALRSFIAVASAAVLLPLFGVSAARADDDVAAGDTVVGEFTQVWQDFEDLDVAVERADEALLSFVRTEEGESVRVDTDDVGDLEIGTTVELTVGGTVPDAAALEDGYEPAREGGGGGGGGGGPGRGRPPPPPPAGPPLPRGVGRPPPMNSSTMRSPSSW